MHRCSRLVVSRSSLPRPLTGMPKRKAPSSASQASSSKAAKTTVSSSVVQQQEDRLDPKQRGIHKDAIQAELAPSSRACCVDCGKVIAAGSPRWGIKYGGNPLPQSVIPLYGTHPMVMWCHAGGCGLAFTRLAPDLVAAVRTCHYCSDSPDDEDNGGALKLLCGGTPNKDGKIRQHAFHIKCWKEAIEKSKLSDKDKRSILIEPSSIGVKSKTGLAWDEMTKDEQAFVLKSFE